MLNITKNLALASALMVAGLAHSIPQRWNGPANDDDTGTGVAVDAAGNSFTVGTADSNGGPRKDVVIVARNAAGNVLWQRLYDGGLAADEFGRAIVLDGFGNLFVMAEANNPGTGRDVLILKYTVFGAPVARQYFNGAANGDDVPKDIAYDPFNFVVVVGSSQNAAGNADGLVIRMMDNLLAGASNTWNGAANGFDQFNAVALDQLGNIYLTGQTFGGASGNNFLYQQYATNLMLGVSRTYNGLGNGSDVGVDIAYELPGIIHIAGTTYSGAASGDDMFAMRFPRNKNWLIATKRYDRGAGSNDRAVALAVGPMSSTVVVGTSVGATTDLAVVRFSSTLAIQWAYNLDGPAMGIDAATSVATLGNDTFVTGASEGATGMDAITIGLNNAGAPLWGTRYDFAGNFDSGAQVVVNPMGVFIAGTSIDVMQDQFTDRMSPITGVSPW